MTVRTLALPELETAWSKLERAAAAEGIQIAIADYGGFRTQADTTQILGWKQEDYNAYAAAERRAGRTPLPVTGAWDVDASGRRNSRPIAQYGTSYHDYAGARDFTIKVKPKGMTTAAAMKRVQDLAEQNGLRSGRSFGDNPHLELPITLSTLRDWYNQWQSKTGRYASSTPAIVKSAPPPPASVPPPGGEVPSDDGSSEPPGGNTTLFVLGTLVVIGGGLLVARFFRGS